MDNNADTPFITCENLVKIYTIADLEVVALQGLDLAVKEGELLALIGPSGSGKSTLMNILGGLDRPSAGKVSVDGRSLLKLEGRELDRYRREEVGFVWQQPARNLIPYLSAEQNVELPMLIAGVDGAERARRTEWLLEEIELTQRRHHRLGALSGGEQQRVAIAVALANKPRLLLADEPTGEVNTEMAQRILDTFQRINADLGLTIVIVTHDPQVSARARRVIAIRDGRTSTEHVRAEQESRPESFALQHAQESPLIVVDVAGRLQIPRSYLAEFGIGDRVRLEPAAEGLVIHPVAGRAGRTDERAEWHAAAAELYVDEDAPPKEKISWWERLRKGKS